MRLLENDISAIERAEEIEKFAAESKADLERLRSRMKERIFALRDPMSPAMKSQLSSIRERSAELFGGAGP